MKSPWVGTEKDNKSMPFVYGTLPMSSSTYFIAYAILPYAVLQVKLYQIILISEKLLSLSQISYIIKFNQNIH